jgi:hypothetical protein
MCFMVWFGRALQADDGNRLPWAALCDELEIRPKCFDAVLQPPDVAR